MKSALLRLAMALFVIAAVIALLPDTHCAEASTGGHTQSEAVAWVRDQVGKYFGECAIFAREYYGYLGQTKPYGNAYDYLDGSSTHLPSGWTYQSWPQPGDIVVWDRYVWANPGWQTDQWGHIGVVVEVYDSTILTVESNINSYNAEYSKSANRPISGVTKFIRPDFASEEIRGSEMSSGYDRVLPDGDYLIANAADPTYFLDISGGAMPAGEGDNVQLWHTSSGTIGDCDAWTIKYENGFYRISQYGQSRSLDVSGADTLQGKNVQVWGNNTSSAQKWAISQIGWNGYRIQAKCSGYSLDIKNGSISEGTNVRQWSGNDSTAQTWVFIPYKPSQPIVEGRYILVARGNTAYELDVAGDTGDVENGRNVQIWNDESSDFKSLALSQYNSFDVKKVTTGYYKLIHTASGKCLDVQNSGAKNNTNICLATDNGNSAQRWAITPQNGGYMLRAMCSGYALDLLDGKHTNGQNVAQHFWNGSNAQTWYFVPAEHAVTFNANGGSGAPAKQTKYYKGNLTLSSTKPTRAGYTFQGWATSASATSAAYQPGGSYTTDADVMLYAVWRANTYTVSYNANTTDLVANMPTAQAKTHGVDLTLSADWPTREGYSFICWSEIANGYSGNRYPGSVYTKDAGITFYAMWEKDGSEMTSGAGKTLLEGDYTICAALDEALTLDIEGTDLPSADGKNVGLSTSAGNAYDAWTLTYLGNGFYAIKQYRTDMALTVADDSAKYRANIQVNTYTGSTGQQWSIERTDYGYRLKARCSGFSADIPGGADYIKQGTNVQQWNNNEGDQAGNQSWTFRPFKPAQGMIPDFTLPASLKTVEAEAFIGGAFRYVRLPEGIAAISARAFADCPNLEYIYIPEECSSISKDAFSGISGLTIFGVDGSYAEFFAEKYGYKFEATAAR